MAELTQDNIDRIVAELVNKILFEVQELEWVINQQKSTYQRHADQRHIQEIVSELEYLKSTESGVMRIAKIT